MHKNKPELHVEMKSAAPGLTKVLQTFPEAARPMIELIDIVLRTMDSPLSMGQRELLFTAASWNNGCVTDAGVHSQLVGLLMDDGQDLVEVVRTQGPCAIAGFDPKMHELIHLAVDVTKMVGLQLSEHMSTLAIGLARDVGCSDREIHDTVLIGSLAAMVNRYVDALTNDGRNLSVGFFRETAQAIVARGFAALNG